MKIAVFIGSIREGRTGITVGNWALEQLQARGDGHDYQILDLKNQNLNPLTAAKPPAAAQGTYEDPNTQAWATIIDNFDGFIFVTPEYNASIPGTMKDAFDQVFIEWQGKPVGFISYGGGAGRGAVKHWRDIVARAQMLAVQAQASFNFREHFPDRIFTPGEQGAEWINALADELSQVLETANVKS